jgi:Relaxase/Mobilisation nuclease domain
VIVFKGGGRSARGARTGLGKGFAGLAAYLKKGSLDALDPDRVAWVAYRNLEGVDDPAQAAQQMRAHAEENRTVEKPVYHFGLSLHQGEHLSAEQWNEAVDRVLTRMGLDGHQAVVIAHRDTDKEHVHLRPIRPGRLPLVPVSALRCLPGRAPRQAHRGARQLQQTPECRVHRIVVRKCLGHLGVKNDDVGRLAETASILATDGLSEVRAPVFRT